MSIEEMIRSVMEFASETDALKNKIYSMSDIFAEHVCKIVYYEPVDVSWYKSVYSCLLPTMKKIKSKSKRLSSKTIKSLLYDPNFEEYEDFEIYLDTAFDSIVQEEGFKYLHLKSLTREQAYVKISSFWNHVIVLCEKGRLTREQCTMLCQTYLE